jgi:hypothetical protein
MIKDIKDLICVIIIGILIACLSKKYKESFMDEIIKQSKKK